MNHIAMSNIVQRMRAGGFWAREIVGAVFVLAIVITMRGYAFGDDDAKLASKWPTAWLRVGDPPSFGRGGGRNPAEYEQYRKTQMARIKSPLVLNAALNKPEISNLSILKGQSEPLKWIEDNLLVIAPMQSEIVQVTLPGVEPRKEAAKLVNAIVVSYVQNVVNGEQIEQLRKREIIEKRYKEAMAELQEKRQRLEQMSATAALSSALGSERKAQLQDLSIAIRRKQLDVDLQKASAEVRLKMSEGVSASRRQAEIDLKIAESQSEVLQQALVKLSDDLQSQDRSKPLAAELASKKVEIRQREGNAATLAEELDRLKIELFLPPRVTLLDDASE